MYQPGINGVISHKLKPDKIACKPTHIKKLRFTWRAVEKIEYAETCLSYIG